MRLRPRHVLAVMGASVFLLIIYLTHPYYETWHGFQAISDSRRLLANRPATTKHPILILQHLPKGSLAQASRASHALYAKAWGYRYAGDSGKYVEDGPRGCLNKEHVLRAAMGRELTSPKPAEWIVYSDADAIVSDPAIPLHALLPPHTLQPEPQFLFGQDHNGLNAGVFVIRVSPLALAFVERVLALGDSNPDPLISDQHWVGVALRSNSSYGHAFAEMPRTWMNAYFLDEAGPGTGALGGDDEEAWTPQWQVHLVNRLKRKYSFRPLVDRALDVYQRGVIIVDGHGAFEEGGARLRDRQNQTLEGGEERKVEREIRPNGLERLPQAEWAREHAEDWWAAQHTGIDNIRFLDEARMKIVDRNDVVLNP